MRRKWSRVICSPRREDAPGHDEQASRYRLGWTTRRAQSGRGTQSSALLIERWFTARIIGN